MFIRVYDEDSKIGFVSDQVRHVWWDETRLKIECMADELGFGMEKNEVSRIDFLLSDGSLMFSEIYE